MACEHWIELLNEERERVTKLQAELAQCWERLDVWRKNSCEIHPSSPLGMLLQTPLDLDGKIKGLYVNRDGYRKLKALGEV